MTMAELHLRFIVRGNKTVTKIGKKKEAANVIFRNDDPTYPLTLDIDEVVLKGARKPRKGRKLRHYHYVIPPGSPPQPFPVGGFAVDTAFKYTAQIGTSIPEDPIIIIEK
jgi:hypothetical protein